MHATKIQALLHVILCSPIKKTKAHRIFITTSLLQKFISTQDELALVLGHEISHLILGHSSSQNTLETSIRTIEILLLSLDPTEGLLSLAFMTLLASLRSALGASYSREHEREADELGIKLTAMACFDTKEASVVFHKMHLQNLESGMEASSGRVGLLSFFDTHPPSDERFRSLLEVSIVLYTELNNV
jgi:Zn-dependent protease with chaperone function